MKQKIFLKKSSRLGKTASSSASSLFSFRNVFKFVIIILFWVAFIPLLWHQKTKNAEDKPPNAKVVKEVPKSPAPAAPGESSSAAPETAPAEPVVKVPPVAAPVVPPPTAKAESPKSSNNMPAPTKEPLAARPEDQAKPPIMPMPEAKPIAPSPGSSPVDQGATGAVSVPYPGEPVQGVAAAKPVPGLGPATTPASKPGDKSVAGEKPKPAAGTGPTDKPRTAVTANTGSGASGAKPASAGAEQLPKPTNQIKITKQKAPVKIARSDGRSALPAVPPKPAAPGAAVAAPPAPSPPAEEKPKESLQEASWVYIVHVGSFQNPSQAQDLQKKLQKKGYSAVVKSQLNLQKGKIYNVELKSLQDAAEARTKMSKLQAEEQLNPVLLKVMEKH